MFWALVIVGGFVALIAGLWFLVCAFRQHVLWGLAVLFLPFAALIFLIVHWAEARGAFFAQLFGTILCVIGLMGIDPDPADGPSRGAQRPSIWSLLTGFGNARKSSRPSGNTEAVDLATPAPTPVAPPAPPPIAAPPTIPTGASTAERRRFLEREIPRRSEELTAQFKSLGARRQSLPPGDQAALDAFNRDAAAYAEKLAETRRWNAELETMKASDSPTPAPKKAAKR